VLSFVAAVEGELLFVGDEAVGGQEEFLKFERTAAQPLTAGEAFDEIPLSELDSQSVKGKPTVITFWGIWCAPCIAELPAIQAFQSRHPTANTVAVEIGDKPEEIKAFLKAHKLDNLHVAAQADWPAEFGFAAAPMSVVMDRFGQIQFAHEGLLADVEGILGKDLSALPEPN
jgi:thiol-disulfide isomerase/thioredoxin